MNKFTDVLDLYLDLRDELKNEEDNFNSIDDRRRAREVLNDYRNELNKFFKEEE